MYQDSELIVCAECGKLGMTAPNLWGKATFFHKVPATKNGYFTFTEIHQFI
jgi:hypothetical protein